MFRWIMYLQPNIPGSISFTLTLTESLAEARDAFEAYEENTGVKCSATLYAYDDAAYALAEEFRDIGCPFDYPDRQIERGLRGGVRVTRC